MTTVTRPIHFAIQGRRKRAVLASVATGNANSANQGQKHADATDANVGRVPRVARLMALAIRFEGLIEAGVVANQSELARLARVTQPRMSQIMNLLHLAPDIQEEILFLSRTSSGRDSIHEHMLREIAALVDWMAQRSHWNRVSRRQSSPLDGPPNSVVSALAGEPN